MIVYFDESYDNDRHYLLYGALFMPEDSRLHQRFLALRREAGVTKEIKYTDCRNRSTLRFCKRLVDVFLEDTAYFRCVVVDQHGFDYSGFGSQSDPQALKKARAYKKFAEMLLAPNVEAVHDGVFLADQLTRCNGDEFLERIRECFNRPGARRTFRRCAEVDSSLVEYQCVQVCDLLLGCVLNNLKPTKKTTKNEIRKYLCRKLEVPNFLYTTWKDVSVAHVKGECPKFNVWYWSTKKKPR